MAKLSVIVRNEKRKRLVDQYAERRKKLKQQGDWKALDQLPRNSSPVRLRNRCKVTGRPRGFLGHFGICRNVFREMSHKGLIPGIKKASW